MLYKRWYFPVLLFLLTLFSLTAKAQQGERYRMANHLMNQHKFEEAYNIYADLIDKHPDVQSLYDQAIKCLINLKRYDEAISMSRERIEKGYAITQTSIRLGEIYHLQGDTSRAFTAWDKVLEQNSRQLQAYLKVARTMKQRKEYDRAIEIYLKAQNKFGNEQLFANELAHTYQMAGQYEKAIRQYLTLIEKNPGRANFVKRSMMRFQDDYLFEVAVIEFNDYLSELPADNPAYRPMHELYQWLLLEMDLFERALAETKSFEQKTRQPTQALFRLGNRLLSVQKFELAQKAFSYYRESSNKSLRLKSLEKLGDVYLQWADFLSDYNLVYTLKRDTLYNRASAIYTRLLDQKQNYDNVGRVLMKQAELSLDHLKKADKASFYYNLMQKYDRVAKGRKEYINGRIKLYNNQYDRARIAFTNSHKASDESDLTEKARYYLALTNFYSGDFEYAQLQLKALEKQSSSYYANDAVQLRMWMQDGMQKDSATAELSSFAAAMHQLEHGKLENAMQLMSPWLFQDRHPLKDDAVLALARRTRTDGVPLVYSLLSQFLNASSNSPLRERLLWERARIAEQIVTDDLTREINNNTRSSLSERLKDQITMVELPATLNEVRQMYEQILLSYPQGFYSTYARDRIQNIENIQT